MEVTTLLGRGKRRISRGVRRNLHGYRDQLQGLMAQRRVRREIDAVLRDRAADRAAPPLPDFLIIGAPKCATSWLSGILRRQPRVLVVPDEIEYFSSHLDWPLEWYLDHFRQLAPEANEGEPPARGEKLILGEKSAGYCAVPPARIRLVHRLLPNVRLVLMIRDPIARHWSHAKRVFSKEKARRRGYETLESPQQMHRFFSRTRRYSEFSTMIENWTDVYPAEQLLVVSQEAAFADPRATVERVMRHIGAFTHLDPGSRERALRKKKNKGPSVPMPPDVAAYLKGMFAGERQRLEQVLSARFSPEAVAEINLPRMYAARQPQ